MKPLKFIISGGGTGGHIYPALAIADGLKAKYPNAEFLFVGARDRMEMEKIPQAGYKIEGLWITGIKRELTLSNLMFPFKLVSSLLASAKILRKFKPDVVIGTGGFASGPLLQSANNKNIPTLIQEQNSYAGITNKLLGKKAKKICVAYDHMEAFFPIDKIVKTGNPVRQDLLKIENKRDEGKIKFNLKDSRITLLVLGGSLGARAINNLIADNLDYILEQNVQVIWQTGKLYFEQYKEKGNLDHVSVTAYIDNMNLAYAAADIIISRAGAGSVSELCIVGKPVIFIPSPNVAEDHQTKNAKAIADKGAAVLLPEKELETNFRVAFDELLKSPEKQQKLGENIKKLALPNATDDIIAEVEKLFENNVSAHRN